MSKYEGHPGAWRSENPTLEFPPVQGGDTIKFIPRTLPSNHPLAPRPSAASQILSGFRPLGHMLYVILIFLLKVVGFVLISLVFACLFVAIVHGFESVFGGKKKPTSLRSRVQS